MNVFFVFYFAPATNCMILIEVCLVNTQKKEIHAFTLFKSNIYKAKRYEYNK